MSLVAEIRYAAKNFTTGLGDVQAIVYNDAEVPLSSITLDEIADTGVYAGSYVSGIPQTVTVVVDSVSKPAKAAQKYVLDEYDDADIIAEIQQVQDEVWDNVLASHVGSGTFGVLVQDTNTELGASADAANPAGTAHAKLAEILARIGADAGGEPNTLFEYFESIQGSPTVSLQTLSTDLQAIIGTLGQTTSNIRYKVVAPAILERPEAGTLDHRYVLFILDSEGSFADPDGSHVWIEIEDPSGVDIVASATLDRDAEGIYSYTYAVDSSHTLQQEVFKFHFEESAAQRTVIHTTFVQDKAEQATVASMVADLTGIKGSGFATGTDSLKIISDNLSQLQVGNDDGTGWVAGSHSNKAIRDAMDTQLSTILNEILDTSDDAAAVWEEVAASHSAAGTMGALVHTLDTKADTVISNQGGIEGAGFVSASHSLVAIVADIEAHDLMATTAFGDIKGASFSSASHSLKAIRDALDTLDTSTGGYAL